MTITATVGRIGANLLAMVRTRLELAAIELQEDTHRLFGYLAWAVVGAFFGVVAVLLAILFVLAAFWDTHRLLSIGIMIALFAIGSLIAIGRVRAGLNSRPPLLANTLAELRKDVAAIKGEAHDQV